MNSHPVKHRKQNYVDKTVQGALIRRILSHWVCFFVVTAMAFVMLQFLIGEGGLSIGSRVQSVMREYALLAVLMLSLLPAFVLDTIRFSNRLVGPMVRLRRCLRELGEHGNTNVLRFRDGDFWGDVAVEFNRLRERIVQQQKQIDDLRSGANMELDSRKKLEATSI